MPVGDSTSVKPASPAPPGPPPQLAPASPAPPGPPPELAPASPAPPRPTDTNTVRTVRAGNADVSVEFAPPENAQQKGARYGRVAGEGVGHIGGMAAGFFGGGAIAGPPGAFLGAVAGLIWGDDLVAPVGEQIGKGIGWVADRLK